MKPEDIDKISDEVWKQMNSQETEEQFNERFKQFMNEGNLNHSDSLAAFALIEATRISFNMTVELLKRILTSDKAP